MSPGFASLLTAAFVVGVVRMVVRPPRRLGALVRPYTISARTSLGRSADVGGVVGGTPNMFGSLFRPIISAMANRLGRILERTGDDVLERRIAQAGLFPDVERSDRLAAYRMRQLGNVTTWTGAVVVLALSLSLDAGQVLAFLVLGVIIGATRQRGALERAIEQRRERMRIEIYTVNQLLALRVRSGGGVVHAVAELVGRGSGEVIAELQEALRGHRAGATAAESFQRAAEETPEPFCARTYSLLAMAEERGSDLGEALLALSEDVRESRREAMRRTGTRRRAAMLIPTIVILAPVMLLFIGAPLPSLILGF